MTFTFHYLNLLTHNTQTAYITAPDFPSAWSIFECVYPLKRFVVLRAAAI